MLLLLLLVLMIASYHDPGWWIWLTLILQLVATAVIIFSLFANIDKLFLTNKWLVFVSHFYCFWIKCRFVLAAGFSLKTVRFHSVREYTAQGFRNHVTSATKNPREENFLEPPKIELI